MNPIPRLSCSLVPAHSPARPGPARQHRHGEGLGARGPAGTPALPRDPQLGESRTPQTVAWSLVQRAWGLLRVLRGSGFLRSRGCGCLASLHVPGCACGPTSHKRQHLVVFLCRSYINDACFSSQPSGAAGFRSRVCVRSGAEPELGRGWRRRRRRRMKGPGWVPQDAPCQQGWGRSRAAPRGAGAGFSAGLNRCASSPWPCLSFSALPVRLSPFSALGGKKPGVTPEWE